ncbi:MAG: hypothetical protein CVU43_08885 [Chloroflexi bacterium HGW-Chloroflexi-5]|nr:MAG: hypothetical protein CVU43_08885 [Chloroflexi bacterium HGW-Chloroflexi-5]
MIKLKEIFHHSKNESIKLTEHENRILIGLVDFYHDYGYQSKEYNDSETGGIYEHKFATRVGYQLQEDGFPPVDFQIAVQTLEERGLVNRFVRNKDFPIKGIWPTAKGFILYNEITSHEKTNTNANKKLIIKVNWILILTVLGVMTNILMLFAQIFTLEIRSWFGK